MTYSIRPTLILLIAGVVTSTQTAFADEVTTNYDTNFLDRSNHQLKPTFMVTGNDFHKHSYHRMLMNSPHGRSSIGLGVNAQNKAFSADTFEMMHPEASGINEPTPTERLFIENAYAPKVKKGYNAAYETEKAFGREQNAVTSNTNRYFSENNPFDSSSAGSGSYSGNTNYANQSSTTGSATGNSSRPANIKDLLHTPAQPQEPKDRIPSFLKDTTSGSPSEAELDGSGSSF